MSFLEPGERPIDRLKQKWYMFVIGGLLFLAAWLKGLEDHRTLYLSLVAALAMIPAGIVGLMLRLADRKRTST